MLRYLISKHVISSVNLSEVVARMADAGRTQTEIRDFLMEFEFEVVNFDAEMAYRAGMLRPLTRQAGLSFEDRACLALAQSLGLPVSTVNWTWAEALAQSLGLRVPLGYKTWVEALGIEILLVGGGYVYLGTD